MKLQLQITTRDVPHSEALETHIRQKVEKLETFYPKVMGCRVVVDVPHKHKHQGRTFNVRLDITVPGKELVVNHEAVEAVDVAVRDAFGAAERPGEDYGRGQGGSIMAHTPVVHGTIVRLRTEDGSGFSVTREGVEL